MVSATRVLIPACVLFILWGFLMFCSSCGVSDGGENSNNSANLC